MAFGGFLKQSTAVDILLGPFLDNSDGHTAETGLTLDVELSKNGQALANKTDATTPVHDAAGDVDGYYNCELDATDTGTLGIVTIVVHNAGALACRMDYQVVNANWWDSMCSTEHLDVNVAEISDSSTAADNVEVVFDTDFATNYDATNDRWEVDTVALGGATQSALDLKDFSDTGYDPATHKVAGVVLADTCTTNTDMVGTDNAFLAASAPSNFGDLSITATTGRVDVASIEGSDATDQIRDAVVDDATRIDASQLNTHTAITAAAIVNEWESQSQADPTGFHVNVKEVNGTAQTANDNSADINSIVAKLPSKSYLTGSADADGGIDTTEAAVINAQVDDVISTDTHGEPAQGAPGTTISRGEKLDWLFKYWRNKVTTTSSVISIYNDAGDTVDHQSAITDDGTTFTKAEFVSG